METNPPLAGFQQQLILIHFPWFAEEVLPCEHLKQKLVVNRINRQLLLATIVNHHIDHNY